MTFIGQFSPQLEFLKLRQTMICMCQKTPEKSVQVSPTLDRTMVPKSVKDAKTIDDFKNKLKGWIWENIH
jgi:hypothetical protein